jgi:integrase
MPRDLLTDFAIRKAVREFKIKGAKVRKLNDGDGLVLLLRDGCQPAWSFSYERPASDSKRQRVQMSLGPYPDLALAKARLKAQELRTKVAEGVDPKAVIAAPAGRTFREVADLWFEIWHEGRAEKSIREKVGRIKRDLLPRIGDKPIASIRSDDILAILNPILARKRIETAKRAQQIAHAIFKYAKLQRWVEYLPTEGLEELVKMHHRPVTHVPSITKAKEFGELLRTIDTYPDISQITRLALQLLALVAVRPGGEFRLAKWSEFDLEHALWTIPAKRMKMRKEQQIPLSRQALAIVRELERSRSYSDFVFYSERNPKEPMSDATLNMALKRMGFAGRHVPHGFRASFMTLVEEQNLVLNRTEHKAASAQLAHKVGEEAELGYERAEFAMQRRALMQRWADFCDKLRGAN